MREHAGQWLKILCWTLVAIVLFQTGRALVRNDPFGKIVLPVPPTLTSPDHELAAIGPTGGGPAPGKTPALSPTNSPGGANLAAGLNPANRPPVLATNQINGNSPAATNAKPLNASPAPVRAITSLSTNRNPSVTNAGLANTKGILSATNGGPSTTNAPEVLAGQPAPTRPPHPPRPGLGFPFPGMGGPGQPAPDLPPLVRARIDQIVNSELLGPVFHPQPMALLGIAGETVFLRAASGESGLVKVGGTLGDLKLTRIGINRVLVEQNGQTKELTIFSGMGSDSLLTTSGKSSNETTNH